jgi:hypothetical protein
VVLRARDVADDGIRSGRRSCCVGGVRLTHAINRLHLADVAAASEQSASSAPSIGRTLPMELLRRSSPPRPRRQLATPCRRSCCVGAVRLVRAFNCLHLADGAAASTPYLAPPPRLRHTWWRKMRSWMREVGGRDRWSRE